MCNQSHRKYVTQSREGISDSLWKCVHSSIVKPGGIGKKEYIPESCGLIQLTPNVCSTSRYALN